MIKKIIFVNYEAFSEKIRQDFVIDYLISQHIQVEYWDVTLLFRKKRNYSAIDFVSIIHTYNEFEERLKSSHKEESLIVSLINLDGISIKLYRKFTTTNVKLAFFCRGLFPSLNRTFSSKFISIKINYLSLKRVLLNQLSKCAKKTKYIKEYDYVFASGRIASERFTNSSVKQINFFDYDTYNEIKKNNISIITEDYCLFLDVNAPFHEDLKILGVKSINAALYFAEINSFFDKIEKKFGLKVVIASHPSSNYDPNIFEGREIIKYKSPELVQNSKFVISSVSTSISYAILFNKPLLFIYTQDMKDNYNVIGYTDQCENLASILKVPYINISKNYELPETYKEIEYDIRNKFIKDYYTSDLTKDQPTNELLIQYLKDI